MKTIPIVTASLILLVFLVPGQIVNANGTHVKVLFDFSDGSYLWADVTLESNRTALNATVAAVEQLDLDGNYHWESIDGLYIWDSTDDLWMSSSINASDLILEDGDSIAWTIPIDGSITYPQPIPGPTPDDPYPSLSFRLDTRNSGNHGGHLCSDTPLTWKFETNAFEISSTPATVKGRIFVPTWEGLYALDEDQGSLLWVRGDIKGMSSPSIYGDGLFIGANDGKLHYLSTTDGQEIWNVTLIDNPVFTGIASSPRPYANKVFIGLFNESGGKGGIVALYIDNKSVAWRHEAPSVHMSMPAIHGDTLYVGVMGYYNATTYSFDQPYGLLALNVSDGSSRWFLRTNGPVSSSPLLTNSSVIFTSRDGIVHALTHNGSLLWNYVMSRSTSSPATDGLRVFVTEGVFSSGQGYVTALNMAGERLWRQQVSGPVQSSPLYADSTVFVATNEENGTLFALSSENGRVLWAYMSSPPDYILSSPIVSDGRVILAADNGIVYSFGCAPVIPEETDYTLFIVVPVIVLVVMIVAVYAMRRRSK